MVTLLWPQRRPAATRRIGATLRPPKCPTTCRALRQPLPRLPLVGPRGVRRRSSRRGRRPSAALRVLIRAGWPRRAIRLWHGRWPRRAILLWAWRAAPRAAPTAAIRAARILADPTATWWTSPHVVPRPRSGLPSHNATALHRTPHQTCKIAAYFGHPAVPTLHDSRNYGYGYGETY